ncbi:MAG: hypothetical protein IT159_13645 [Bryobacterales bacterium]|nr:hypothetical protein [Bryobacterales bacterium]
MSLTANTTAWMALAHDGGSALTLRWVSQASRWPWLIFAVATAAAVGGGAGWAILGYPAGAASFWWRVGAVSLTMLAFGEYILCLACWRFFEQGAPLRRGWLFLTLAAGVRAAGVTVAALTGGFGIDSGSMASGRTVHAAATWGLGLAIANPLTTGLSLAGLCYVLKTCREGGLLRKPSPGEVGFLVPLVLFLGARSFTALRSAAGVPGAAGLLSGASALAGPLLGLFLAAAVLLCRPVQQMGEGLIARCWGASIAAAFLTVAGVLGNWATSAGYLPWQYGIFNSLAWLLAATAFTLAPAHQVEAVVRARHPWLRSS